MQLHSLSCPHSKAQEIVWKEPRFDPALPRFDPALPPAPIGPSDLHRRFTYTGAQERLSTQTNTAA